MSCTIGSVQATFVKKMTCLKRTFYIHIPGDFFQPAYGHASLEKPCMQLHQSRIRQIGQNNRLELSFCRQKCFTMPGSLPGLDRVFLKYRAPLAVQSFIQGVELGCVGKFEEDSTVLVGTMKCCLTGITSYKERCCA